MYGVDVVDHLGRSATGSAEGLAVENDAAQAAPEWRAVESSVVGIVGVAFGFKLLVGKVAPSCFEGFGG